MSDKTLKEYEMEPTEKHSSVEGSEASARLIDFKRRLNMRSRRVDGYEMEEKERHPFLFIWFSFFRFNTEERVRASLSLI